MGNKLTSMPTFEQMALMLIWCELVNKDLLTLASPMFKSWCTQLDANSMGILRSMN
jgi:hypothetical protein